MLQTCSEVLVFNSALVVVKKFAIDFIDRESDEVFFLFGIVLYIIIKVE